MERSKWVSDEDKSILRANAARQRAQERGPHILDPKKRRFGLDVDSIQKQIEEKEQMKLQEKIRDADFDEMLLQQQELVLINMEKEAQLRKQMAIEEAQYRKEYQKPEQSREYDIWRKDKLKISQPARIGDKDPRLGISSGQFFEGEDLKIPERITAQGTQRIEWYKQQKQEENIKAKKQNIEELRAQLYELETQKTLTQMMEQDELIKTEIKRQLAEDNKKMMIEKKSKLKQDIDLEKKINEAEIKNTLRTRVITEEMCPRTAGPMEYRGMSIEEQKAFLIEQQKQIEEVKKRKESEKERDRQWEEYQRFLKTEGDKNELDFMRKKAQKEREMAETLKKQQDEFSAKQQYLNKEVYTKNIPDDSYYNQWGYSTR